MITQEQIQTETIRALSWKQPYAGLMLHGKVETRTWDTKYRGLVLICASKARYSVEEVNKISGSTIPLKFKFRHYSLIPANSLVITGHAIAIGRLINSREMVQEDENRTGVVYRQKLFCHVYQDVTPIEPFPWKGTQGWKTLDKETIKKIKLL